MDARLLTIGYYKILKDIKNDIWHYRILSDIARYSQQSKPGQFCFCWTNFRWLFLRLNQLLSEENRWDSRPAHALSVHVPGRHWGDEKTLLGAWAVLARLAKPKSPSTCKDKSSLATARGKWGLWGRGPPTCNKSWISPPSSHGIPFGLPFGLSFGFPEHMTQWLIFHVAKVDHLAKVRSSNRFGYLDIDPLRNPIPFTNCWWIILAAWDDPPVPRWIGECWRCL